MRFVCGAARIVAAGMLFGVALSQTAAAAPPDATPAVLQASADCSVAPRSKAEMDHFISVEKANDAAGSVSPDATPVPTAVPTQLSREGAVAASPDVRAAVEAVAREWFACANAGDAARGAALMTDRLLESGDVDISSWDDPENTSIIVTLLHIYSLQVLNDGRVGGLVAFNLSNGVSPMSAFYLVFQQVDGRWLIDDILWF